MLSKIRGIARSLLGATEEERSRIEKQYLARLTKLGILQTEATVDNILDLDVKDLMERRLQTMVYREGLAKSIHQARQFVTHGHISIEGKTVSVPGYIVRKAEEAKITFHERSPLNNAQHPARGTAGESRKSGLLVEPVAQEGPRLPEVSREIQEAAKAEQPLVMEPVTEEAPPTVEKE